MKTTYQWSAGRSSSPSEVGNLRTGKVNELHSRLPIADPPISKVYSAAERKGRIPPIGSGCSECKTLASVGKMAQLVSHDLRNHLTAIYSNVELMSEPRTTDLVRKELLDEVRSVVWDITGMLDSLLILAKTGEPPHPRWESFNQVVERAMCSVCAHPDARNVDLVLQDAAPVSCWMDPTKIGSAIYNLLLNACQAAQLGLAPKKVQVTFAEDQQCVHLRVIDSGHGVPAGIRKTLFQPFVSAERINGMGLGLSIVDSTAREHGGYVDLEESEHGTIFGFHISKYAFENGASRAHL